jgi:hypothetical protein
VPQFKSNYAAVCYSPGNLRWVDTGPISRDLRQRNVTTPRRSRYNVFCQTVEYFQTPQSVLTLGNTRVTMFATAY